LLTNAIRYGGPRVSVRTKGAGDRRFLTIDDDGPGVPDERRETIFNPYETAHARNGQPGSVGLGLTVARQLARLMDGELRYERKNNWTRFTLDMPAQPTSNDATLGGSGPPRRAGHVPGAAALSEAGNRG
ncbi:MAG: ATP-binding protein, partial [Acidimicrobiia bacterium]|nr:ATP-binding protein [Acidimicrobiia bacterium]